MTKQRIFHLTLAASLVFSCTNVLLAQVFYGACANLIDTDGDGIPDSSPCDTDGDGTLTFVDFETFSASPVDITGDGVANWDDQFAMFSSINISSDPDNPQAPCLGDWTLDGTLDSSDTFTALANNGNPGSLFDGDLNGDGVVNFQSAMGVFSGLDGDIFQANAFTTCSIPLPEPTGMLPTLLATALLLSWRRK
jgi:hypothetical protein